MEMTFFVFLSLFTLKWHYCLSKHRERIEAIDSLISAHSDAQPQGGHFQVSTLVLQTNDINENIGVEKNIAFSNLYPHMETSCIMILFRCKTSFLDLTADSDLSIDKIAQLNVKTRISKCLLTETVLQQLNCKSLQPCATTLWWNVLNEFLK